MVHSVVREWHEDEGWCVLDSAETPGGCWAHYSAIETTLIERSGGEEVYEYRAVRPGDIVELTWEQPGQDGFAYRAVALRPER